jgi:trans-aconitate methyltransferase
MTPPDRFDAAYYRRFYGRGAVHDRRQIASLATAITSWATWWKLPIRSVLDVGAGKGYWKEWFATARPRVRYRGLDVSPHACRTYGHELADISDWVPPRAFDLVVCQSMLQYLDDESCDRAIAVLARACAGLLYLEVPTAADRVEVVDVEQTDMDVNWRTGDWYRQRLDPLFVEVGAGVWVVRPSPLAFFELEISGRSQQ